MFGLLRKLTLFDRRRHERFELSSGIKSRCVYARAGKGIEFSAVILNVSESGVKISTGDTKILPKTTLEISIDLPDEKKVVLIRGEVVRTYRRHNQDIYYCGVHFKKEDKAAIKSLLSSLKSGIIPKK